MKRMGFPDWTAPAYLRISLGGAGKEPLLSAYNRSEQDLLSRRVSVDIAGGSCLFETFENEEARNAAYLQRDREAAWRSAIKIAELLVRSSMRRSEYVVAFIPASENTGPEFISVYRRIELPCIKKEAQRATADQSRAH